MTRAERVRAAMGIAWVLSVVLIGYGISYSLALRDPPSAEVTHEVGPEDDLLFVNNTTCAMSGSSIDPEDLGRYESRVVYDGPDERYRGRTLVFNQCCEMCITSFPEKWARERDDIMYDLGLIETLP